MQNLATSRLNIITSSENAALNVNTKLIRFRKQIFDAVICIIIQVLFRNQIILCRKFKILRIIFFIEKIASWKIKCSLFKANVQIYVRLKVNIINRLLSEKIQSVQYLYNYIYNWPLILDVLAAHCKT